MVDRGLQHVDSLLVQLYALVSHAVNQPLIAALQVVEAVAQMFDLCANPFAHPDATLHKLPLIAMCFIQSHVLIGQHIDFAFEVFPLRLHLCNQLQCIIH